MAIIRGGSKPTSLDRALDQMLGETTTETIGEPMAESRPIEDAAPPPAPGKGGKHKAKSRAGAAQPESDAEAEAVESETRPEPTGVKKRGILFVHGIGTQKPGETLIDWSSALVRSLSAWQESAAGQVTDSWSDLRARNVDPVVRSEIDFEGGTIPLVEVAVPRFQPTDGPASPGERWIITEAWWAARLTQPSLSAVIDWTSRQGVFGSVVVGIVENGAGSGGKWGSAVARFGLSTFMSLVSSLVLLGFSALRGLAAVLPIQSLKDFVVFRQFETFLLGWWGDVYQLLRDPVQAANIRGQMLTATAALVAAGCDEIIVIAHSGGTVVAYETLRDRVTELDDADRVAHGKEPLDLRRRITKLITLGEAINLVRPLPGGIYESADQASIGSPSGGTARIQPDPEPIPDVSWDGAWIDFWATHDPAPNGALNPEGRVRHTARSHMVWNRRSIREDHGEYFANEEEFVRPVLREIDSNRDGAGSRFPDVSCGQVTERHQRVQVLTLWRRIAFVAPFTAVLAVAAPRFVQLLVTPTEASSMFTASSISTGIDLLTQAVIAVWNAIPGLSDISTAVGKLVTEAKVLQDLAPVSVAVASAVILGVFVGLLVHAILPIRRSDVWLDHPSTYAASAALDFAPLIVFLVLLVGAILVGLLGLAGMGPWAHSLEGVELTRATSIGLVIGLVLLVLTIGRVVVDGAMSTILFSLLAVLVIAAVASVAIAVLVSDGFRATLIGTAVAFVAFRPLVGYGGMRWTRWDAIERDAVRHQIVRPARGVVLLQVLVLFATAGILAWGLIDLAPTILGRQVPVLAASIGLILMLVILNALRDARSAGQGVSAPARTGQTDMVG